MEKREQRRKKAALQYSYSMRKFLRLRVMVNVAAFTNLKYFILHTFEWPVISILICMRCQHTDQ